MPPEPAEIVRKVLEAWGDDDPAALRALAHPEVEIVPDPMWLEQGRMRGEEGALQFFQENQEDWKDVRLEVLELREGPRGVVARSRTSSPAA